MDAEAAEQLESHLQTLIIYKLGFNQNNYSFTPILLIKIVLCREFPWIKFMNHKFFDMKSAGVLRGDDARPGRVRL